MKIAFFGPMCSGKSTISKYLEETYDFKILSFASHVKEYCKEIFDMKYKDRKLLQDFANKCREINENVWVNLTEKEITKMKGINIVIDDLRFPNEYKMLKRLGFIVIKLDISPDLQYERIMTTYPVTYSQHITRCGDISESFYNDLDYDCIFKITKETEQNIQNDIKVFITHINNELSMVK